MSSVADRAHSQPRGLLSERLKIHELTRKTLIGILRDGSQHMRPPNLYRQDKDDLVSAVERALLSGNFRLQYTRLLESYVWEYEVPEILDSIKPTGINGGWTWTYPNEQEGFLVQSGAEHRTGRVCLRIIRGDKVVHSSYHDRERWAGHCGGKLIIDPIIAKLKADAVTGEVGAAVVVT